MTSDHVRSMLARLKEVRGHAERRKLSFSTAALSVLVGLRVKPETVTTALRSARECEEESPGKWRSSIELDDVRYWIVVSEASWGASTHVCAIREQEA